MLDLFAKKESPMQGMMGLGGGVPSKLLTLASGEITYVEDVFSTYLYKGNQTARSINNGINLASKGGMVWLKSRGNNYGWRMVDTERGATKALESYDPTAEATESSGLTAFTSTGFTLGTQGHYNGNGYNMVSYAFRECPGFFDIVTYTGTPGSPLTINHNLGSVPGCIMIKNLSSGTGWAVYHRGANGGNAPYNKKLVLNTTAAQADDNWWNNAAPTATSFQLSGDPSVNAGGNNYVAYLFAHNDGSFGEDSDEAVIKCGNYTGSGSIGKTVDLGFEPQWMLVKSTDQTRPWVIIDNMRGMPRDGNGVRLLADDPAGEVSDASFLAPTPTGFEVTQQNTYVNVQNENYIYIAIRRPHKPPEAGTDVFTAALNGTPGDSGATEWRPENVDMAWFAKRGGDAKNFQVADRIRGFQNTDTNTDDSYTTPTLSTNNTNVEATSSNAIHQSHYNSGLVTMRAVSSGSNFLFYRFKRAPGFFDIVAYKGTGSSTGVNHGLGVTPELKIIKNRDSSSGNWIVGGTAVAGENGYLYLDDNSTLVSTSNYWDGGDDSATKFSVRQGNASSDSTGQDYIAYLFATLPGISKIGTYTGTGSNINIDCGFTNGARFVMIKRITSGWAASWWIFDTLRGIGSGNDPAIYLDTTGGEYNTDRVAALNSGFTVGTGDYELNQSGKDYIFLAIA